MRTFDFNYLVEKSQIVVEMAKPSVWGKMSLTESPFAKFNEIYAKARKQLEPYGNAQRMVLDYLIVTLGKGKIPNDAGSISSITTQYAKEHADEYSQWMERVGKNKGTKYENQQALPRREFYLTDLVKKNLKYVADPKFEQTVLNPENMKDFATTAHGTDMSVTSPQAAHHKTRKEEMYGKGLGDIYQIKAAFHPLQVMINRLMKKKRNENWEVADEIANPAAHLAHNLVEELSHILSFTGKTSREIQGPEKGGSLFAKRQVEQDKTQNPRKYFGSLFSTRDIESLMAFLEEREDSGVGITEEQWARLISKMQQTNPAIAELGQYLLNAAKNQKEANIDESDEFEGYDREVLARVLDTPEKEDLFRTWYEMIQAENDRATEVAEKKFAAALKKDAKYRRSSEGMDQQIQDLMLKAEESDDPSEIHKIKQQLQALYAKKQANPEEAEESIMGYMAEQVSKDSHSNVHGEFVERGFKKPVNYAHWLALNER